MEETVFPTPEVSGLLAETVEARLHLDMPTLPTYDRMVEVRDKFSGVKTAPVYLIIDPETDRVLARQDGASAPSTFRNWLKDAIRSRG